MKITVVFCALTTLVKAVPLNLDEKSQEKERKKLHLAPEPTVANINNSVDSKLAVKEHQVMKPNPYATHHVYNFNDRSAQEMAEYQNHWSNIFLHAQQQRLPISPVADLLPSYNLKQMMPQDIDTAMHSSEHRSVSQDIRKPGFEYNIILCNSYLCMPDSLKVRGSDLLHSYNLKLAIPWDADSEMYPTYRNVRPDVRIPGFRNRDMPWIRRNRDWSEEWCMPFDGTGEVALFTDVDSERFGIPSSWSRAIVYIPYIVAPLPLPGTIAPPVWWCRYIDDDYIYYLK